jgi:hypothetical protein
MRDFQDHQVLNLFGGIHASQGCRGRRSQPEVKKRVVTPVVAVLGALLIGFATAATAITIKTHSRAQEAEEMSRTLPANLITAPGYSGFEAALY